MKKTLAIILALVLVMSLATTAFATEITIAGGNGREFNGYRLMSVTVNADESSYNYVVDADYREIMANQVAAISGKTRPTYADPANPTDAEIDAVDLFILDYLRDLAKTSNAANVRKLADAIYKDILAQGIEEDAYFTADSDSYTKDLAQGYWLLADVTVLIDKQSNSLVMVDTVGNQNITITTKPDVPEFEKKIDDKNDSETTEDGISWQDSADYDIGDSVPYQITVTLPNNIESYISYDIVVKDTLEDGLTYNKDFEISLAGNDVTEKFNIVYSANEKSVSIYPKADYYDFTASEWKASDATNGGNILAADGVNAKNNNVLHINYTCTLNEDAVLGNLGNPNVANMKFSNNPYGKGQGTTPDDVCIVFTYQTVVNKVDGNQNPLTGADFTLYKFIANANGSETHNGTAGEWTAIDRKDGTTAGTTFTFKGLDDGHYKLEETTVPDGYNGMEPYYFRVTAEHNLIVTDKNDNNLTSLIGKATVSGTVDLTTEMDNGMINGTMSGTFENHSGTKLPTTGGMGTTMFYILGSMMAIGAAVLLVTKKRMSVA